MPSRARIVARAGMRVRRPSSSPRVSPGNTRWGSHATAGSPSSASPSGSVTLARTSPKIRVRTSTGTVTVSSSGWAGRAARSRAVVAVVAARRYARAKRVIEVRFWASGVSIEYIAA